MIRSNNSDGFIVEGGPPEGPGEWEEDEGQVPPILPTGDARVRKKCQVPIRIGYLCLDRYW